LLELGVDVGVLSCEWENFLYTKFVTISPRFVLINKMSNKVALKTEDQKEAGFVMEKDVRNCLEWSNWEKDRVERNVCIRLMEDNKNDEHWKWSTAFNINNVGVYNFEIQTEDGKERKYMKVAVSLKASLIFVTIEEQPKEEVSLKVFNDCE